MKRAAVLFTLGLFVCLLKITSVQAQATAQISGTVRDPSGAVLPGVEVTATQTETGIVRTAVSNETGSFVLPNLALGPYKLEAALTGFRTFVQTGIVLQVNSNPVINPVLQVGQVSEQVEVQANAALVETRSTLVGQVIENARILELPLNGRQPTDLITLSGLAVQTGTSPGYNMNTGVNISVAGSTSYSVQYNLDGASHLDTYDGTNMPLPFPDALQEFRITTSTQDASSAGHSGASVNAVTKAGTNAFHGDAFEFFRNSALNGRDFFGARSDQLKRNQFGGVVGGPIKKDKLFFFAGYQGTLVRQSPSDVINFVPTAAMIAGDFSAYVANRCPEASRFAPGVLDGNSRLTLPISPAAAALASRLPKPLDACGTVKTGNALSQNQLQAPVRIDYQASDKQSLFARYLITRFETKVPYAITPNDILTTGGVGTDDTAQSLTLGDTYLLRAGIVNSFRIFGNRIGLLKVPASFVGPEAVGIKNFYGGYIPNFMTVSVPGDFSVGTPANFTVSNGGVTNFGFNDDINAVRGAHQLAFGVTVMRAILMENSYAWAPGVFTFGGLPTSAGGTGSPIGDFLTGKAVNLHQSNPNPNYISQNFFGTYIADTWKVSPRLTVNLGLRWNPFFPMQFIQSDVSNFSLSNFYANKRSTVVPTAPPGFTFPGDPGFPGRSGMDRKWKNLEPRIGLAWDPFGDGKTSVRASAGTAYDFIRQDVHQNTSTVAPFRNTVNRAGPINFDNPYGDFPGGNPFPFTFDRAHATFPTFPLYQGFYPFQPDIKTTQQYSWNLAIQRQVTPSLFTSATYVGTQIIHIWNAIDLNPAVLIPGVPIQGTPGVTVTAAQCAALQANCSSNIDQRRILQLTNPSGAANLLGNMTGFDDGGTQRYNGLLLTATWRKGDINLSGNYTWSHCIGLPVVAQINIGGSYPHQPYQNNGPVDRHLDYGDCLQGARDTRHIGNITLVARTPNFSGTVSRALASGWTFSSIYTGRSGYPLTISTGSDVAMNSLFVALGNYPIPQRPNQVLVDTAAPDKGQACANQSPCISYLNRAAFAQPAPGTYGNVGVGTLRSPGFWEWDQSVSRQFKLTESQRLEIRAEAFNVTNSVRLYIANNAAALNLSSGQFGRITTAASTTGTTAATGNGGRIIQFATKYSF